MAVGGPASVETYRGGRLDGPSRQWYGNGALRADVVFVEGEQDGVSRRFWPDGRPRDEFTFVRGVRQGPQRSWHEDGWLLCKGECRDNLPEGRWLYYRWNGELNAKLSGVYEKGVRVGP